MALLSHLSHPYSIIAIWSHIQPYKPYLTKYCHIKPYKPNLTKCSHIKPYKQDITNSSHMEPYGAIWSHVGHAQSKRVIWPIHTLIKPSISCRAVSSNRISHAFNIFIRHLFGFNHSLYEFLFTFFIVNVRSHNHYGSLK